MRLPAEKRSQGPLYATIDLLFLLVCFFLLLMFFMQQNKNAAQSQMEAAQQTLARVTGEETPNVNVSKVLEQLVMPQGTFISGLESDGKDRFFCGGAKTGKVRAVQRPKR